ncbi:MAG: aldehyde dehydrogenase [Bacteroidetes bacterium OLB12]|nr:MAG: aldehyde dehydrogenase [Bacteroidetes bacterium OLB12]
MEKEIATAGMDLKALFEKQVVRSQRLRSEPWQNRKKLLKAFGKYIMQNRQAIRDAVKADLGKHEAESDISEVLPIITEIKHAVQNLADWVAPEPIHAPLTFLGTTSEVQYEPKGVCLIIGPWNFPINLTLGPLVSCLAAGNTAVIKPSELTPNASRLISKLITEFFDEDMVTVVEGDAQTATQLLKLPFDHIFFTGSPSVGKIVMRAASEHLSSVTLELGGKSPTVIDSSANLADTAKRIAFGKFLNAGQACVAPDYVLIDKTVEVEFIDLLKQAIHKLYGDITLQTPHYGRIVNTKNFNRIDALVHDAIQRGAKVEMNAPPMLPPDFFIPSSSARYQPKLKLWKKKFLARFCQSFLTKAKMKFFPLYLPGPNRLDFTFLVTVVNFRKN